MLMIDDEDNGDDWGLRPRRLQRLICGSDLGTTISVPKFADLGGSWHHTVDNFPLLLYIFLVNFPLQTHYLTLVTDIAPQLQPYHQNQRSSQSVELIAHTLLRNFHSCYLIWTRIFHSDTQAKSDFGTLTTTRGKCPKICRFGCEMTQR